jgi:hypothetical protein
VFAFDRERRRANWCAGSLPRVTDFTTGLTALGSGIGPKLAQVGGVCRSQSAAAGSVAA